MMRDEIESREAGGPVEQLAERVRLCCVRQGRDLGDIARQAGVSRTTLYQILRGRTRRPHVATLHRIAAALNVPAEQLCGGEVREERPSPAEFAGTAMAVREAQRRFDRCTNTLIGEAAGEHPELFAGWCDDEWDELYSTFGVGGQLTPEGVAHAAARINHKRETMQQLQVVLETHLGDVAAQMIGTLFRMVRPSTHAASNGVANEAAKPNELNVER